METKTGLSSWTEGPMTTNLLDQLLKIDLIKLVVEIDMWYMRKEGRVMDYVAYVVAYSKRSYQSL